jgi:MarR family transcriptional regulator, organic hydroperoxide resistance regulator
VDHVSRYSLTNSFPYLVNRVGVRIGEMGSRALAPYEVTLPMYRVLASLWELQNQRLRDLGAMTSIELSTLSRQISAMHRKGLVSRTRVTGNERTVSINLTPKGRALAEVLIPLAIHFEEVAIHSFGTNEVEKLKKALVTVYEHLNELESEILAAEAPKMRPAKRRSESRPRRKASRT